MGNKQALVPAVREAIRGLGTGGPVADLFAGMGTVAAGMASGRAVVTNDMLSFTCALARARFQLNSELPGADCLAKLEPSFNRSRAELRLRFARRLAIERRALNAGPSALATYVRSAPHVGTSATYRQEARARAGQTDSEHYALLTLYFSGAYFSTAQAIDLDAMRFAIDCCLPANRDPLISCWLMTAAAIINAPGHTAQFLHPSSDRGFHRIRRQWARDVRRVFAANVLNFKPLGTARWRSKNIVLNEDALSALSHSALAKVSTVYADPPYTQDQYSRFYHVYETMDRYNYPTSHGEGRSAHGLPVTDFSKKACVELAFHALARTVAEAGRSLVLSYPSNGLLYRRNVDLSQLLATYFRSVSVQSYPQQHSSMGAFHGRATVAATERLFTCS